MRLIYDLEFAELNELIKGWDQESYRARQVWQGLYRQFWNSSEQFTNIPAHLRSKLGENLQFQAIVPVKTLHSSDGQTVKILFRLQDGNFIETVMMSYAKRITLCISSQAGCAMGCVFCATGQMGFKRHLTSGEIVAQVIYFSRILHNPLTGSEGGVVSNVVVMGMGEPFHNYDNTLSAIDRLNDSNGYNLGARRFTISTVGLIPAILQFAAEKRQINLAISLHSADDALRTSMLPINKKYPVDALLEASREYIAITRRRITFEWALINGVTDTTEQAYLLSRKLKGLLCHVNVIPLNPTTGYSGQASTRDQAIRFRDILNFSGIPCTIRMRRGIDIQSGCGQLRVL